MLDINKWEMTNEIIQKCHTESIVDKSLPLKACGCGVKIDLDQIVYPTISEITNLFPSIKSLEIGKRFDAFYTKGKVISLNRFFIDFKNLGKITEIINIPLSNNQETFIVELFSSSFNQYREFDKLKDQFIDIQNKKYSHIDQLLNKTKLENKIKFAKGHSIQGEQDFIMLDLITIEKDSDKYTLINNDTIITGDSILKPSSIISVFIALNNALNDLFLCGGNQDITIYPVYDGTTEEIKIFKEQLNEYHAFYKARGVEIKIVDLGPINKQTGMIGATVTATSQHVPPNYHSIAEDDLILLTHNIGDLATLAVNRKNFIANIEDLTIENARLEVIKKLCTPHFSMSEIIKNYLPKLNEPFDSEKHISFSGDISGPGLSILEELSLISGYDIKINQLNILHDFILSINRKNYSTSTNGPWAICGKPQVINKILLDFQSMGLKEAHLIGKIGKKNQSPKILISKELYNSLENTAKPNSFFHSKIKVSTQDGEHWLNTPLFNNIKIV